MLRGDLILYRVFHLDDSASKFSCNDGDGLRCSGFAAVDLAGGAVRALIESAIRFVFTSALNTFTLTI